MIEVRMTLNGSTELAIYHQLVQAIEHLRAPQPAQEPTAAAPPAPPAPPEGAEPEAPVVEEKIIATITPAGVTKPAAETGTTATQVTEAVNQAINELTVPVTREILLTFGHGQVMKIDPAKWPDVMTALATAIAAKRAAAQA